MEEPLFEGQNAAYAQAMFEEYARNPEAVPLEWRRLFEGETSSQRVKDAPTVDAPITGVKPTPDTTRISSSSEAAEHLRR